jgi:mono/diheme cytochrome c family protein
MSRLVPFITAFGVWAGALTAATGAQKPPAPATQHEHGDDHSHDEGWTIPAGAETQTNPLTVNPSVIAAGQKLFSSKCQRCHGKLGKGDGVDAEAKHQKDMDLTNPARASKNPDGVIFYRVWNGRKSPKMPTFSKELSKEQVWAIVAYVQTLRGK